jgi:hypothetical protein
MAGPVQLSIVGAGATRRLQVSAARAEDLTDFDGAATQTGDRTILTGPLSAANAAAVRLAIPSLQPGPVGLVTSAGTGDRLGRATPGHVRAFQRAGHGVRPIFTQQSIREMDRLGRTPQQVLDDATFGCVQAGWDGPVGADADHLKSTADIDRCLRAGFSLYTLDVGDHVNPAAGSPTDEALAAVPWDLLQDDIGSVRRRYADLSVDLGDRALGITEGELRHAIVKYGPAVAAGARMYRHLREHAAGEVEVEIAVDETEEVTTPAEHLYLATELHRLGVHWVSFAPCHPGPFEKGIEFAGDVAGLIRTVGVHARIARALGPYKIGVHSGSDKFSIYPGIMQATNGLVHLKTSGTSYLVALDVAARHDPDLFREIYAVSRDAYRAARFSYPVSADPGAAPEPADVADDDLPALLTATATRQILHVGYGTVLRTPAGGTSDLGRGLLDVLDIHEIDYHDRVADHLARHLSPFAERP